MPAQPKRRALQSEEAVSPIIGVILMVAIVVVLSSVFYLIIGQMQQSNEEAPAIGLRKDESRDRILLDRGGSEDHDWEYFRIRADRDVPGLLVNLSGPAADGDPVGTSATVLPAKSLRAGDYLSLCATSAEQNVGITLTHEPSNTVIMDATFLNIKAC